MKRTVSAMEARRKLGELLESVYYQQQEIAIERNGKLMGFLVSPDDYSVLEQGRLRIVEMFEKDWESDIPLNDQETMEIALHVQRQVRRERHEEQEKADKKRTA